MEIKIWLRVIAAGIVATLLFGQAIVTNNGVTVIGSLPAGSAVIGKVSIDQTTPGTTNAVSIAQLGSTTIATGNGSATAGTLRVAIVSDQSAYSINDVPKTACGSTVANAAWQAIPTTNTLINASATTTCVIAFSFANTNATVATVTVTDNQGSPVTVVPTPSILGNSVYTLPLYGTQFTTGVKWVASGTGVNGAMIAFQ